MLNSEFWILTEESVYTIHTTHDIPVIIFYSVQNTTYGVEKRKKNEVHVKFSQESREKRIPVQFSMLSFQVFEQSTKSEIQNPVQQHFEDWRLKDHDFYVFTFSVNLRMPWAIFCSFVFFFLFPTEFVKGYTAYSVQGK